MQTFKFEKDSDSRWYVVLPEWTGDRSELEMVCGADTLLDIISQGEDTAYISLSETDFEESEFTLTYFKDESEGGWYKMKSELLEFELWLCHVTKFVFGYLPKKLYCK